MQTADRVSGVIVHKRRVSVSVHADDATSELTAGARRRWRWRWRSLEVLSALVPRRYAVLRPRYLLCWIPRRLHERRSQLRRRDGGRGFPGKNGCLDVPGELAQYLLHLGVLLEPCR